MKELIYSFTLDSGGLYFQDEFIYEVLFGDFSDYMFRDGV